MKNNKWSGPLITAVVLLSIMGLSKGAWLVFDQYNSEKQLTGISYSREAYVTSCTRLATSGADALTSEAANALCSCAYDDGTAKYGVAKYSQMDYELAQTSVVTPEMNEIINNCIVKVGE